MSDDKQSLNDKDIMQLTEVEEQPSSGRIRFKATLPSGRSVTSEFFQASSKTAALLKWCEAIRGEVKTDQEEAAAQSRRKAAEARAANPAPVIALPPGIAPAMPLPQPGQAVAPITDPMAFLVASVEQAEKSEAYWKAQAEHSAVKWKQAQIDLERWRQLHRSMSGTIPAGI